MSVIFDTSIWIEYLKGNENYFDQCQQIIENGLVKGVEVVFAELLQGALNKREIELIKQFYRLIKPIKIPVLLVISGDYSRENKLLSKGIGLIGSVIIVSTINSNSRLWTLDQKILKFLGEYYLYKLNGAIQRR